MNRFEYKYLEGIELKFARKPQTKPLFVALCNSALRWLQTAMIIWFVMTKNDKAGVI